MTASSYDPAPAYGSGPGHDTSAAPRHGAGMATTALVLGILALVTSITVIGGVILGLLAIVFGFVGLSRARKGAPGRGRAIAGIVTGVLGLLVSVALIAFGVSILNSPEVKDLRTCLDNANGDQAQVQQCSDEYQNTN